MFIAKGVKSSLQRELDSFYKEVKGADFNIRHVTKGAFSQARAKLKPEAFVEMNENINETFYSEAPYLIWRGLRLVGGDGSTLNLPQSENITKEFRQDGYGPNADHQKTLAIISILYDVLNLVVIDAQISSRATGERELLVNQLKKLKQDDLLLLDRGYPGLGLFFLLAARGIPFCMRMMVDGWDKVIAFEKSGEKEKIVRFTLPKTQRFYLEDFPEWIDREIECRLVRIELKNGETEILCTSLLDFKQYPHPEFKELYHTRWGVEEGFKLLKGRAELENFSGKTALAIKQDFHAKIFMMSLAAILAFPIEEKVKQEARGENERKHDRKINRTNALSILGSTMIGIFIKKVFGPAIRAFDDIASKTLEIVREGRSNPRIKRRPRAYHMSYKRL